VIKANIIQAGDLWICDEEDSIPEQVKFALLIECNDAEECRRALREGTIQFTVFGGDVGEEKA
jgi:hypothetical protein